MGYIPTVEIEKDEDKVRVNKCDIDAYCKLGWKVVDQKVVDPKDEPQAETADQLNAEEAAGEQETPEMSKIVDDKSEVIPPDAENAEVAE